MKIGVLLFIITLLNLSLKASSISVVTYNLNYSFINENVVDILDTINADVICLQETNKTWEDIITKGLQDKYPYLEFKYCCGAGGLAIMSKYPILNTIYIDNEAGWFPASLTNIKKGKEIIQVLNVHLKPGLTSKGRIGWNAYFKAEDIHKQELTHFMNHLNKNIPTLIVGDFNENDKGKSLTWLTNEMNFQDDLSTFDAKTKTWRWVLLKGRYDHIVSNQFLECNAAQVHKVGKSDHFPVFANYKIHWNK